MALLSPSGKESLDQLIARIADEKKIPGFVFGVTSVDKEIYFNSAGYNVVNDPESGAVGPDSMFWICSQTKLVAHIAALQLIDQGKLSLESLVSDYIPELVNPVIVSDRVAENPSFTSAKTAMCIKHLLNFSSGLFYVPRMSNPTHLSGAYSEPHDQENPGNLPGIPLAFEPGESWAYGWSSDIVGFIVEKVSGQSLEQYFQENIFKPLDIKASFYLTPDIKEKLVDLSYRRNGNLEASAKQAEQVLIERDPTKVRLHLGGVGLYASLQGYLNLLRHLLQIKAGNAKNSILSPKAVQSLFKGALTESGVNNLSMLASALDPNAPADPIQWSSGLAICTTDWPGRRRQGSAFWGGWANLNYFVDPTTGVAAVFATQLVPPFDSHILKYFAELERTLYSGLIDGK
ncbi:hypothetical protein CVT25_006931 [Psilocybe cyanescens]|uniref:Beta-lactamase-related domain-containing protein n=1 Tax=Psilocybe cyanescens TaxID=93625 RepID=A0A409X5W5_PSICY|nr:hypothetical protein CVT25_006931 [Psilocybe cyanescens]